MAEGSYDLAICGSTPFAGLLAGLLASVHGKRVCLVGDSWSPYRLARSLEISVMPSARPETWAVLRRGGAETLKLIGSIGRGLYERVDPLFIAETPTTAEYLSHMRWLALGFGFAAERAVDRAVTEDGAICRIRDAAMLVGGKAEPAIEAWLSGIGVTRIAGPDTSIAPRREGGFSLRYAGPPIDVPFVVLADDEAIVSRLPAADRHRLLTVSPSIGLTTDASPRPLAAAYMSWLDRDVIVHQRGGKGPVTAVAAGEADTALPRIGASLAGVAPIGRAAEARFLRVGTVDGAPLIGRMGKQRLTAIAGLGDSAAFLAPIVARYLAGTAADDEVRYFEARDVSKAASRAGVADTAAAAELAS